MSPPIGLIDDALNQAGLRKPPLRRRLLARLAWEWRAIKGRRGLFCRLSVCGVFGFGKVPLELLVEARARPTGFSVWAFNPVVCPKAMEIVRTDHPYGWRAFAYFLLKHTICTRFIHDKVHTPWQCAVGLPDLTALAVLGERGFAAEVLRAALGEHPEPAGWLLGQPADSIAAILSLHRMPFSKEHWISVTELTRLSYYLGCSGHFLAICRLFGDGTGAASASRLNALPTLSAMSVLASKRRRLRPLWEGLERPARDCHQSTQAGIRSSVRPRRSCSEPHREVNQTDLSCLA
jgi:hypothetical protein